MSKVALVIGIDSYPGAPLTCCVEDAQQVAGLLQMPEYGFECTLLVEQEATRANIIRVLREITQQSPERLLFYFSGHGTMTDIGGFLVTVDATDVEPGIDLSQLRRLLAVPALDKTETVVLLDCCHAGALHLEGLDRHAISSQQLGQVLVGIGNSRVVIGACRPDEYAEEGYDGVSLFTAHLIEGMFGGAADHEGVITVNGLFEYVSKPFEARTGQTPVFRGDLTGRLQLATGFASSRPIHSLPPSSIGQEASNLVDELRARQSSLSSQEYKQRGYLSACQSLEPALHWFAKYLHDYPQLESEKLFMAAWESVRNMRITLGSLETGTMVSRGRVVEHLGSGAFGTVWRIDGDDGSYAFKIYHPQEISISAKVSRFEHGYRAMRQLDHPRIVKVFEYTNCPLGFFMDLIEGPNLRKLGPVFKEPSEIVQFAVSIAETVHHAHNRSVRHRDIKPENIIATYDPNAQTWVPYLTDFDLAWYSTATRLTKEAFGAVHYAAPEQIENPKSKAARDFRVDVYSFGQLLYFIVTGSDPSTQDRSGLQGRIMKSVETWGSEAAARGLVDLYLKCTERDQDSRMQNFRDVLDELLDISQALRHTQKERLDTIEFLKETQFLLAGLSGDHLAGPECSFTSRSKQTGVTLAVRELSDDKIEVEITLRPQVNFGMPGVSLEKARGAMNSRIDAALSGFGVRRRSGKSGVYQVHIDVQYLNRTHHDARRLSVIVSRAIDAMERM